MSFRIVVTTNKLSDIDLLVSVAWAVQAETEVCDTCSFIMADTFRNWYPRMHDLIYGGTAHRVAINTESPWVLSLAAIFYSHI